MNDQAAAVATEAEDTNGGGNSVTMKDGRLVDFPGKRKMVKTYRIEDGQVICRFDFVNGETRELRIREDMTLMFAGHGGIQKVGDSAAGEKDVDDMVEAVDSTIAQLNKGPDSWNAQREAGGFSGTSLVIKAIVEVTGKTAEVVKAGIEKKLEELKNAGKTTSRQALYASFRQNPKIAAVVKRLEEEKLKNRAADVDTDSILSDFQSASA